MSHPFLTPALRTILEEMRDAEAREDFDAAEIVCDGQCLVGARRIHHGSVVRLLQLTAISKTDEGLKAERYRINDTGKAILRRPLIIDEIMLALRYGGAFTIKDDRVVLLCPPA